MNLRDPGVHLVSVSDDSFNGRAVRSLEVNYDPEVGSERWTFHFDPGTAELVGCAFDKVDPAKTDEYFILERLIEAGGLRLAWGTRRRPR